MTTLLPYLLKVVLCSGLLMLYYYLALRNKLFHQWNRFYLLATVLLSLLMPCFSYTISHTSAEAQNQVILVLQVVTVSGSFEEELPTVTVSFWKTYSAVLLYAFVSMILLIGLLLSLIKIYRLVQRHTVHEQGKLRLIFSSAKGTPFSFFRFLFWNPSIDMTSEAGQQIFQHEMVHVEEKHSLDKLFLQIALIICWINPVFWLIRYELRMVHEFIADRKAVEDQDASALAAMILQAAYPHHYSQLTNAFFNQSIKRRLHMLTKIQNPKRNYISRIFFLPLMALLTLAFTVRAKLSDVTTDAKAETKQAVPNGVTANAIYSMSEAKSDSETVDKQVINIVKYTGKKKIRIVIDAGHGGHDNGTLSNEIFEKDITLSIAKEIQALNSNANIEVVMTRENDEYLELNDRAEFAAKQQADLFVSVHVGAAPPIQTDAGKIENPHRGFNVFIPRDSTLSYFEQSKVLGSAVLDQLNTIVAVPAKMQLLQRNVGIRVLNNNTCPSILIECGYISNSKDRTYLLQKENQQQVARKLLAGIEAYLQTVDQKQLPAKNNDVDAKHMSAVVNDTIPPVVLQSGVALTVPQLQNIPFANLIQPDTDYVMINATFRISKLGGTIHFVKVHDSQLNSQVKNLIDNAKAGDVIYIGDRLAITKDKKVINLPSLLYNVK
ncbi:N-acetylmuramoyl-L-alanine amidase [Flavisolibacter tropicus]|uniref:N-acetylmuramoyl-L-alanine amidase n=1 Tax=Flavisolibacter tropicus TaxID=1492898 RepID=A0A172TXB2_9BACT|nr:N-acetylmuramoyl-L-alanine amidase [Flavisolibacter tropicus]ANE51729.1 hypothetical protein SY85_15720 [Flavisolibacter tropicus]